MDMKSSLTVWYLLASVIGVSVLGVSAMAIGSDHQHGYASCIAIAIKGNVCPEDSAPLGFLNFHLHAFNAFSLGVINTPTSLFLATVLMFLLLSLCMHGDTSPTVLSGPSFVGYSPGLQIIPVRSIYRMISWLTLHERPDSAIA